MLLKQCINNCPIELYIQGDKKNLKFGNNFKRSSFKQWDVLLNLYLSDDEEDITVL